VKKNTEINLFFPQMINKRATNFEPFFLLAIFDEDGVCLNMCSKNNLSLSNLHQTRQTCVYPGTTLHPSPSSPNYPFKPGALIQSRGTKEGLGVGVSSSDYNNDLRTSDKRTEAINISF